MKPKWILMTIAGLVGLLSSVAAVSAYEAHTINVKAHVENALTVDLQRVELGTVFPQEWFDAHANISLSESFLGQQRVNTVVYGIFAECKANPAGGFYPWAGEWTYLDQDGVIAGTIGPHLAGTVNDPLCTDPISVVGPIFSGTLVNPTNTEDLLSIGWDTPVFEGYYNNLTDVCDKPRPNNVPGPVNPDRPGCEAPTFVIPTTDPRYDPEGVDVGVDIKVQILSIS